MQPVCAHERCDALIVPILHNEHLAAIDATHGVERLKRNVEPIGSFVCQHHHREGGGALGSNIEGSCASDMD
jgi:hypothetical protein